jgi:hypothetical protein
MDDISQILVVIVAFAYVAVCVALVGICVRTIKEMLR